MNVRCPSCETVYRVDPAKVPEAGIKARCSVCSSLIPVQRSMDGAAAAMPAPAPAAPRITQSPARPIAPAAPARRPQPAPVAAPPKPAAPAAPAPPRPSAPVFRPTRGAPVQAPPAAPPRPGPAAPAAPAPARPVLRPSAAVPAPSAAPAAGATTGKHVNPFLAQDPRQKARRLARALISDMIVYQPEKRQQALKDGTLKTAFEEEIKKSWEEYVMQVGEEVAKSTSFFNDALNEILAGGQKVF